MPAFEMLFTELAQLGIEVFLVNPARKPWNPLAGKHPLFEGLDLFRALRILTRRHHGDVILTVCESGALPLLLLRRMFGFRLPVVSVDISLASGWRIRDHILNLVMPRLDGVIVLASNQIGYIRQKWPTRAPIEFIHQHIDVGFFRPGPFVADGPVLTVGDDCGRDYVTLLTAIEGLDLTLVAKTGKSISDHPTLPHIRVLRTRLPWKAYRTLYEQARFVVLPLFSSIHSSGVSSLLEAMAMGKAVIVSDSPGLRDYVVADVTGLVVPCGDASALRAAIRRLTEDDTLCRRLGNASRQFVEANCAYNVSARRTAAFLRRIMSDVGSQPDGIGA